MLAQEAKQPQLGCKDLASDSLSAERRAPTLAKPKEDLEAPTPAKLLPPINGP